MTEAENKEYEKLKAETQKLYDLYFAARQKEDKFITDKTNSYVEECKKKYLNKYLKVTIESSIDTFDDYLFVTDVRKSGNYVELFGLTVDNENVKRESMYIDVSYPIEILPTEMFLKKISLTAEYWIAQVKSNVK